MQPIYSTHHNLLLATNAYCWHPIHTRRQAALSFCWRPILKIFSLMEKVVFIIFHVLMLCSNTLKLVCCIRATTFIFFFFLSRFLWKLPSKTVFRQRNFLFCVIFYTFLMLKCGKMANGHKSKKDLTSLCKIQAQKNIFRLPSWQHFVRASQDTPETLVALS